ncbi:MAG: hypothetical protein K5872_04280 [Rhizobiaceae bacterium]|nr:hypothetical protein [Rhizobiaceae bacterium]MCV0405428.1 hypothetical protein [Rhizobiaceae bacterium]
MNMLARRFTIVCLIVMLFGFALSALVAEASRPARSSDIGSAVPCVFEGGTRCLPPIRR